jgi:hypothetical protein
MPRDDKFWQDLCRVITDEREKMIDAAKLPRSESAQDFEPSLYQITEALDTIPISLKEISRRCLDKLKSSYAR